MSASALAAESPAPVLDVAALARLEGDLGGRDALRALIRVYLDQLASTVAAIDGAARDRRCAGVARSAHQLKSSTALLGATRLASLSAALEHAGKSDDSFACRQLARRLAVERDLVAGALEEELARV